jgi:predicted DsbA family dithiol-disulfide isomerase
MQTRVVGELFAAYFENEQDITKLEVLKTCGVKSGLSKDEVTEWLNSDKGGQEVDEEIWNAKVRRISGVPNYTVNGLYRIFGAQDSIVFLNLFQNVKAREGKE